MSMNFNQLLQTAGSSYEASLRLIHDIKRFLAGSEYEAINLRLNTPSIYVGYKDSRLLVFDLRKGTSAEVFFWRANLILAAERQRFKLVLQSGTGWLGMPIRVEDKDFKERLLLITSYWASCLPLVDQGQFAARYKRQQAITCLVQKAYVAETVVPDKRSINGLRGRPDIYLPESNVVIEVDGKQHFERVSHLQKTEAAFLNQLKRDKIKNEYCVENEIPILHIVTDAADALGDPETLVHFVNETKKKRLPQYLIYSQRQLQLLDEADFWKHYRMSQKP